MQEVSSQRSGPQESAAVRAGGLGLAEQNPRYEWLSWQDASFVLLERRATHMHVAVLAIFELGPLRSATGGVDAARLARYGASRLQKLSHYRQKLAFAPLSGRPVWVDDPRFDLDYHLRHTAPPAPGSEEELKRLVGRVLSQPLDRDRPLWEMWLVEGLEGERFALLIKVHHCMMDGVAGANLMTVLFRTEPDASIPPAEGWSPREAPSSLRLLLDEAFDRARTPFALARGAAGALRAPRQTVRRALGRAGAVAEALRDGFHRLSPTALERPIGPHRRVDWRTFELADFKALGRHLGGTVNDVVLAIAAGATRRFLERRGERLVDIDYRVVVPVSERSPSGDPGVANRVSAFFLSLPVATADPLARFDTVCGETARLRDSRTAEGVDLLAQLVDRAGSAWLTGLGLRLAERVQPYNQIVSNVPGPQYPLYLLGARLLELFPLGPLFERQGLGTTVMSYDGRMCWGILADRDLVPDLAALARDVEAAWAELREAAASRSPAKRKMRRREQAEPTRRPTQSHTRPSDAPERRGRG
jgi:WS/DGAT/MGAT family acyltransferase